MPSFKIDRTTEDIHRELTAILREVKDPRVKDCLLSLVRVEVTNDLSYCTVYVSTMEGLERSKTAVQGLKSAAGFIRRELGKRLSLRHVPQLIFKATDSIEYGTHISQLLHKLEPERLVHTVLPNDKFRRGAEATFSGRTFTDALNHFPRQIYSLIGVLFLHYGTLFFGRHFLLNRSLDCMKHPLYFAALAVFPKQHCAKRTVRTKDSFGLSHFFIVGRRNRSSVIHSIPPS